MRQKTGSWLVVSLLALLGLAAPAQALPPPDRSLYVPTGLTQTASTPHFVLHYNPSTPSPESGMTIGQYAQAGVADFEEAYGRDVVGGALTPNAGLKAPVADDDAKTDVYLSAPLNKPTFSGGTVYRDSAPYSSAYVFMTPGLSRRGFRFRAAHEFMHVLQRAYSGVYGEGLGEGFANWAAEWALPDVDPLDNNFYGETYPDAPHPWLPLDCSYGTWKTNTCGNGYWQWLFVQAQVEDYGPSFVSGYYERFALNVNAKVAWLLDEQIKVETGGAQSLRSRFAAYAADVWDPTRWTTGSISRIRDEMGLQPAAYNYGRTTANLGWLNVNVDHLAVRYLKVRNDVGVAKPGDQIELSWTRPAAMAANVTPLVKYAAQAGWNDVGGFSGAEGSVLVPFGPEVEYIVLPLVNDSLDVDEAPFGYRVQLIAAPDTTAPRTLLGRHPPKRTTKHTATFYFRTYELPVHFECKLDKRLFAPCRSPKRVNVPRGRHTFQVRAIDGAGNIDITPAKWSWTVTKPRHKTS